MPKKPRARARAPHPDTPTRPGRHGGSLKTGNPGNKGGGRPSNEFKARMRGLADRWAQAAEVEKVLDNPEHPHWLQAGRFAAEHGYGKPETTRHLTATTPEPLVIRVVDES